MLAPVSVIIVASQLVIARLRTMFQNLILRGFARSTALPHSILSGNQTSDIASVNYLLLWPLGNGFRA